MWYMFKSKIEIKCCDDCPLCSSDPYGAEGCELLNDYLNFDTSKKIANNCPLEKVKNIEV